MSRSSRATQVTLAMGRQKERLTEIDSVSGFVLLIPFLAVIVLSLFTSLETNTRLHAVGKPMEHATTEVADHELWLSVAAKGGKIIVTTSDSNVFEWSEGGPTQREALALTDYLKSRVKDLIIGTVRTGQVSQESLTASVAVDQSLTYQHIRPLLYALADAGISRYGFETRIVK